jgi:hypothetical protein
MTIPSNPAEATTKEETSLGPIGMAINGVAIYNDREGGNVPVDSGTLLSFDKYGAHSGPGGLYHYHFEPSAIANANSTMIGHLRDGFPVYGRRDTRLPESNSSLMSTKVAADRVTFTYAAPPEGVTFEAGQVIVGKQDGGYLRKVKSTEISGNTLVILTDDAVLTDAIANQKMAVSIDPSSLRASKIPLLDVSGRVLVDTMVSGVPLKITIVRGTAQLEPSIDFELDISKRHLNHLAVTMKGTMTLNFDVKVEAGGTVTLQQEIDLSGPTASLYTYPFVFPLPTPIGPLPVAGTLEVDAFAGFHATVTAAGTLTTGIEGTSSFGLRASWDNGQWTVENLPAFDGMIHRPQLLTLLASEARAYVRPEVGCASMASQVRVPRSRRRSRP